MSRASLSASLRRLMLVSALVSNRRHSISPEGQGRGLCFKPVRNPKRNQPASPQKKGPSAKGDPSRYEGFLGVPFSSAPEKGSMETNHRCFFWQADATASALPEVHGEGDSHIPNNHKKLAPECLTNLFRGSLNQKNKHYMSTRESSKSASKVCSLLASAGIRPAFSITLTSKKGGGVVGFRHGLIWVILHNAVGCRTNGHQERCRAWSMLPYRRAFMIWTNTKTGMLQERKIEKKCFLPGVWHLLGIRLALCLDVSYLARL